ncbi:hypothetical protein EN836_02240 [Mesorhizobium sp. M1C.F.Ca.ET.193.01.1.1]|uniref:LpxL/LpxP family acyltransferase n=1 Tax=unclassified Mesorhizobium TaxID=325217 RepID=UPI000FD2CE22|nr:MULTISPECIES: hypothetical protein [unclassified Mesorhizobium]TGT04058.1 hypothetical protein EN820_16485 [bacterium M00.F.Ca.ET.177.01.1.1]TGQ56652.1 hypothetical protein EN853_02235 [Mesorhizobium sp. M1C.F.Ca.ET.210.01.1.1]TGQ75420.1 hypothetical protein EN855_002240 [Mesorhizobium sp. M1C.F.Ca.ET.212.01.1.1]TGR13828.1 hypothetical protein EN847_02240 [Mesorhizobium sp. M1C.F.Ca.ET.204.01.1.1]TGR34083.1 hypothetical protein EN839_02240 [Mesorhizobium sp. M1C.F.Ca.ET.196.01.1.1]
MQINVRKRKRASRSGRVFVLEDLGFLLRLPVFVLVSLLVPEKRWRDICIWLEGLKRVPEARRDVGEQPDLAGFGVAGREDRLRVGAMRSEHNIQIVREWLVGWRPEIELRGAEHLEAASSKGHGAVLWVAHFAFNGLAGKMAFAKAGFDVFHVSRPEHGFSKSRFGIRFLNPIRTSVELRYAAGRIVIDRANPAASMNEARRLLRQGKFVYAGAWEGELLVRARIGQSAIELAGGAPRLARIAGAPVLPVFVVRDDSTGKIRVTVEKPIDVDRGRDKAELIQGAAQDFADRHLAYLKSCPHQWRDWEKLKAHEGISIEREAGCLSSAF